MRIEQQFIAVPAGVDIVAFIRNGGKTPEEGVPMERAEITLGQFRDRYLETHGNGSLEKTSLDGIRLHFLQDEQIADESDRIQECGEENEVARHTIGHGKDASHRRRNTP
jgi:hypothetical protein